MKKLKNWFFFLFRQYVNMETRELDDETIIRDSKNYRSPALKSIDLQDKVIQYINLCLNYKAFWYERCVFFYWLIETSKIRNFVFDDRNFVLCRVQQFDVHASCHQLKSEAHHFTGVFRIWTVCKITMNIRLFQNIRMSRNITIKVLNSCKNIWKVSRNKNFFYFFEFLDLPRSKFCNLVSGSEKSSKTGHFHVFQLKIKFFYVPTICIIKNWSVEKKNS